MCKGSIYLLESVHYLSESQFSETFSPTGAGLIYSAILANASTNSIYDIRIFLSWETSSIYDCIEKL